MPRSRQLSLEELTHARLLYEQGATFAALAEQLGVPASTLKGLFRSLGFPVRPRGRVARQSQPRPQPAGAVVVEISHGITGRLRIPCRTVEERRLRTWTPPERRAIDQAIRAGLAQRVRRGTSGLPERPTSRRDYQAAGVAFYIALQKVKAAA